MISQNSTDLRERLISAALLMLEEGEDMSLRALARDVGVSAMAPYRHFSDKEALLEAVAAQGFTRLRDVLLEADRAEQARDAIVAQGEAYIAFARSQPALFRLMFAGHGEGPPPVEDNAYGVLVRRVRQMVPDPAKAEGATLACWAVVHGLATLALDGGLPPAGSPHVREAITIVVAGIPRQRTVSG